MTNELYHITATANLESINAHGLLPWKMLDLEDRDKDRGLTGTWLIENSKWRRDVIWLTHDPEYITRRHAAAGWNDGEVSILLIDVDGLDIRRRDDASYFNDDNEDVEFLCYEKIPVDRIKMIDTNVFGEEYR